MVEVHSVDGFQGREKEAVVISFTRSNDKGALDNYGHIHNFACCEMHTCSNLIIICDC